MRNQLVYDLPTRVFHWLFAGLFFIAFGIAKILDDDSPLYAYHSLAGIMLAFLVIWRIVWGFLGTEYARFSSFKLHPKKLVLYLKGILAGQSERSLGHNPASSWAAIFMMIMVIGLGTTGYLMTSGGDKEIYEEFHELFANGFFLVVILHVAGVILHTIRHREAIGLSMVDGKKMPASDQQRGISSSQHAAALVLILLVGTFSTYLWTHYDTATQSLNLFGSILQLGEDEGERDGSGEHMNNDHESHNQDDDEKDDDD